MSRSFLQEPFMRELAQSFVATRNRILRRIAEEEESRHSSIIEDELRGLCHGLFVTLDGGSGLADQGLVVLQDENRTPFDRFLHEICFQFWPKEDC